MLSNPQLMRGGFGGAKETPDFQVLEGATFAVNFRNSLTPLVDAGNGYVYSRGAAGGTITGFEKLVKNVANDEVMIDGARRGPNLTPTNSENLDEDWEKVFGTGTATGNTITFVSGEFGAANGHWINLTDPPVGVEHSFVFSLQLSGTAGETIRFGMYEGGVSVTETEITLTATPTRYSIAVQNTVFSGTQLFVVFRGDDTDALIVTVDKWQIEEVSDETVGEQGIPSEYVSVGVGDSLLADGTFSDGGTSWDTSGSTGPPTISFVGNTLSITHTIGGHIGVVTPAVGYEKPAIIGKRYVGSVTVVQQDSMSIASITYGGVTIYANAGAGAYTFSFIATNTDDVNFITVDASGFPSTFEVDDLVIVQVDHGTNVDGTQYHDDDNRNTVNSNVITEVDGKNIQPSVLKGVGLFNERNNFADTDQASTQTIDISTSSSGWHYFKNSGNAAWIIGDTGTTAISSSPTFPFVLTPGQSYAINISLIGTIVCTKTGGTLDLSQAGDNLIQLEDGQIPSSFIPSPGATIITRPIVGLQYSPDNYADVGWYKTGFWVTQEQLDGANGNQVFLSFQDTGLSSWIEGWLHTSSVLRLQFKKAGNTNTDMSIAVGHHNIAFTWDKANGLIHTSLDGATPIKKTGAGANIPATADIEEVWVGAWGAGGSPAATYEGNITEAQCGQTFLFDADLQEYAS